MNNNLLYFKMQATKQETIERHVVRAKTHSDFKEIIETLKNTCNLNLETIIPLAYHSKELLTCLVHTYHIDINSSANSKLNKYNYTALHFAAKHNNVIMIDYLITVMKADIENNSATTPPNATALGVASYFFNVEAMRSLLAHGASINADPLQAGQKQLYDKPQSALGCWLYGFSINRSMKTSLSDNAIHSYKILIGQGSNQDEIIQRIVQDYAKHKTKTKIWIVKELKRIDQKLSSDIEKQWLQPRIL